MGERFKTWAVVDAAGGGYQRDSHGDALRDAARLNLDFPTDAPHRAVHLVEMDPAELAEFERWKARPVAGSDTPPPLKVGDVVDGHDPAQLARIPEGAETEYTVDGEPDLVRRVSDGFDDATGFSWGGDAGTHRIVSLPPGYGETEGNAATGECDCGKIEHGRHHALCPASGVPHTEKADPPTPPAPVEGAEDENEMLDRLWDSIDKNLLTCRQIAYEFARKAITARDAAIRAEERRRCEAELERGQKENQSLSDTMQGKDDCIAELRARIDELEARLAQSGSGEQGASSLNITLISSWLRQMADDIDDVAAETKVQTVAFALKHLQARVRDLEKEICDMLRAEKGAVQEVEAHAAAAQEGRS